MSGRLFQPNPYCSVIDLRISLHQSRQTITVKLNLKSDFQSNLATGGPFYYKRDTTHLFNDVDTMMSELHDRIREELCDKVQLVHEMNLSIREGSKLIYANNKTAVSKKHAFDCLNDLEGFIKSRIASYDHNKEAKSRCVML